MKYSYLSPNSIMNCTHRYQRRIVPDCIREITVINLNPILSRVLTVDGG